MCALDGPRLYGSREAYRSSSGSVRSRCPSSSAPPPHTFPCHTPRRRALPQLHRLTAGARRSRGTRRLPMGNHPQVRRPRPPGTDVRCGADARLRPIRSRQPLPVWHAAAARSFGGARMFASAWAGGVPAPRGRPVLGPMFWYVFSVSSLFCRSRRTHSRRSPARRLPFRRWGFPAGAVGAAGF